MNAGNDRASTKYSNRVLFVFRVESSTFENLKNRSLNVTPLLSAKKEPKETPTRTPLSPTEYRDFLSKISKKEKESCVPGFLLHFTATTLSCGVPAA